MTVTLPEDVLASLTKIDADIGRAIVTLAERYSPGLRSSGHGAELSNYGNRAVIVVTPAKALKRIPGVQLVPLGNGRHLISLARPQTLPQLELDLRDAIERGDVRKVERRALEQVLEILHRTRLSDSVSLVERTIIVLESKRRRRPAARSGS